MNSKAHIVHFGCRLNQYETDGLNAGLKENYEIIDDIEYANLIVINTCTVTNNADYKNRAAIRQIHNKNPSAKIVVTGCYASTDRELLLQLPGVFKVIDNSKKAAIPKILENEKSEISEFEGKFGYQYREKKGLSRAYLKVQDGCNKSCSYCKIPHARGKGISRPAKECVQELQHLIKLGFQEIILTGVNIGWYLDQDEVNFNKLLQMLLEVSGNFYLRLSSIEPADVTSELLNIISHKKFAQFLHVPIQSGSSTVLKRMHRGYTQKHLFTWLGLAREMFPNIHLGTDIIVGFPNETQQEFDETLEFVNKIKFDNIHIFPYSKRMATKSVENIKNKVWQEIPGNIIKERCATLKNLQDKIRKQRIKEIAQSEVRAISIRKTQTGTQVLTENYYNCNLENLDIPSGKLIRIKFDENLLATAIES